LNIKLIQITLKLSLLGVRYIAESLNAPENE